MPGLWNSIEMVEPSNLIEAAKEGRSRLYCGELTSSKIPARQPAKYGQKS
jgi:hypothetical protein